MTGTPKTFIISDTHFGHKNIMRHCPSRARTFGPDVGEMNAGIISRWQACVLEHDTVFHLGDIALGMGRAKLAPILRALPGRKMFLLGNHDGFQVDFYQEFGKVLPQPYPMSKLPVVLSHAPLHSDSMSGRGRWKLNIHGHLHEGQINAGPFRGREHPKYFNASVERIDFYPIALDVILKRKGLA